MFPFDVIDDMFAKVISGQIAMVNYDKAIADKSEFTLYEIRLADWSTLRVAAAGHQDRPTFGDHVRMNVSRFASIRRLDDLTEKQMKLIQERPELILRLPSRSYQLIRNCELSNSA